MTRPAPVGTALSWVVVGYQRSLSPLLGQRCRFHPSCSAYAVTALRRHGAVRGLGLVVWRLARCQPFHPGGLDPVPEPGRRAAHVHAGNPGVAR